MKKMILTALSLSVIAAAPAHAISAHYRAQLERSGCNEMNAGTTCDIHKTKEQNAAAAKHPKPAPDTSIKVDVRPFIGKWHVENAQGQALSGLEIRKDAVLFGGEKVALTAQQISSGALYIGFNGLTFTLKKNGDGNWVSAESMGTATRK